MTIIDDTSLETQFSSAMQIAIDENKQFSLLIKRKEILAKEGNKKEET